MSLSDTVGASGLAIYAEAALVLFLVAFLAVVIQVTRKGAREIFEHDSTLPLDDADERSSRSTAQETPEAIRHVQ
jgi:cbb3-type cytochrome oxidase subunit 3